MISRVILQQLYHVCTEYNVQMRQAYKNVSNFLQIINIYIFSGYFLRATDVPAGTAVARISYGNSVCLSGVSRPGTESSPDKTETPGFHHMIA